MGISWVQILVVVVLLVLLFGRGRISSLMGDVARGIKSFKAGLREDIDADMAQDDPPIVDHKPKQDTTKKK